MFKLLIFTCSFILVSSVEDDINSVCELITQISPIDLNRIRNREIPESREGKCYAACILKSIDIISNDGKLSSEALMDLIKSELNETQINRVRDVSGKCARSANQQADECNTAYSFMRCLKTHVMKTKGSRPTQKTFSYTPFSPPAVNINLPPLSFSLITISLG